MKWSFKYLLLILPVLVQGQHESVLISDLKGVCEPSIKLNPRNTEELVAGIVIDHVARSSDGGRTWTSDRLRSPYGVWGDPVIDVDTTGSFYYYHLSNPPDGNWIDRIVCQRSDDAGLTWTEGSYTGLNGSKDQDKHWSVVDPATNEIFITWTEFDEYGSKDSTCMSRIQFSHSSDKGTTWSEPKTISQVSGNCLDDDRTVEGAVPAIGPDGEVYVSWAGPNGIVFTSSLDRGETWSDEVQVNSMPNGWTFEIPGIFRANGLPITKCDLSPGEHRGRIYINWCDQRNGTLDTDVWMSFSDDKGRTWSEAKKVNQDDGPAHQFFTWMDVDQSTGELYFVFYDRRHEARNPWSTAIFMAISTDGGMSFLDFPIEDSEKAFIPDPKIFFGDYNNLTVHNSVVRPIWTRLEEGQLSVWTSIIDTEELLPGIFRIHSDWKAEEYGEYCLELVENGRRKEILLKTELDEGQSPSTYLWDANSLAPAVYEFRLIHNRKTLWSKQMNWNGQTER